jgi:hypothetical protein
VSTEKDEWAVLDQAADIFAKCFAGMDEAAQFLSEHADPLVEKYGHVKVLRELARRVTEHPALPERLKDYTAEVMFQAMLVGARSKRIVEELK